MVQVATYITDKKDTTGTETAVSADEFVLFHKSDYREPYIFILRMWIFKKDLYIYFLIVVQLH